MNTKHKKIQILNLIALTVILCALPSMSLAGVEWTYLTDMPTPRVALSTSVVDGKIYAIGGRTNPKQGKSRVATVEEYDPATGQWTTKANMPTGRFDLSTCVVNGRIYAIGGFPGGPPTRIVEEYDPTTNTWTRRADLPTGRAGLGADVVAGKIYAIGGGDSSVDVYDPTTDTWTPVTELPTQRNPCVSVVDGKIYAIGGLGVGPTYPALSIVEQYDPLADTWTRKADMPTPRLNFSTAVIDGRIYAIGGRSSDGVANPSLSPVLDVDVYDPATNEWTKGPRMTGTRNEASACAVDGILYVFGGWRVFSTNAFSPVDTLDLNPIVHFNAYRAVPRDGAIHDKTWVLLSWQPGINAVSHDVYMGDNFDDVNEGINEVYYGNQTDTFFLAGIPGYSYPEGLVPGTTYYWRIDEVNDADPNSPWIGPVWSFSVPLKTAYDPDPADGAESVDSNVVLSWAAGLGSVFHEVYFGDNFDEVANSTEGILRAETTYDTGDLEPGKTFYWRVDEFDGIETHKGDVWSFTTSVNGSN